MTLSEIKKILDKSNYSVAYNNFTKPVNPPFIIYLFPYHTSYSADNNVLLKIKHVQIELYTSRKDESVEKKLEDILDEADFFYNKSENYIESERLYQIIYESEMI